MRPLHRHLSSAIVVAALLISGCGGDSTHGRVSVTTASEVVSALRSSGLPVSGSYAYTAQNDTSGLFGAPNGYKSKVNFQDSRVVQANGPFTVDNGGSVEFFKSPKLATARQRELKAASASSTEYVYTNRGVVLRLSQRFQPDQSEAYALALKALKPD